MDIIAKAAAKSEDLRKSGWRIKGVWVSKGTEDLDSPILILKMELISQSQRENLHAQVVKDGKWFVLHDFGKGYVSIYPKGTMNKLKKSLELNHPMMVWESAAERKARLSISSASNRRSDT